MENCSSSGLSETLSISGNEYLVSLCCLTNLLPTKHNALRCCFNFLVRTVCNQRALEPFSRREVLYSLMIPCSNAAAPTMLWISEPCVSTKSRKWTSLDEFHAYLSFHDTKVVEDPWLCLHSAGKLLDKFDKDLKLCIVVLIVVDLFSEMQCHIRRSWCVGILCRFLIRVENTEFLGTINSWGIRDMKYLLF